MALMGLESLLPLSSFAVVIKRGWARRREDGFMALCPPLLPLPYAIHLGDLHGTPELPYHQTRRYLRWMGLWASNHLLHLSVRSLIHPSASPFSLNAWTCSVRAVCPTYIIPTMTSATAVRIPSCPPPPSQRQSITIHQFHQFHQFHRDTAAPSLTVPACTAPCRAAQHPAHRLCSFRSRSALAVSSCPANQTV
jgi:hypothetical protein